MLTETLIRAVRARACRHDGDLRLGRAHGGGRVQGARAGRARGRGGAAVRVGHGARGRGGLPARREEFACGACCPLFFWSCARSLFCSLTSSPSLSHTHAHAHAHAPLLMLSSPFPGRTAQDLDILMTVAGYRSIREDVHRNKDALRHCASGVPPGPGEHARL